MAAEAATKYIHLAIVTACNVLYWIFTLPWLDMQKSPIVAVIGIAIFFILLMWLVASWGDAFPDWVPQGGFDPWDDC